ncbi:MAG: FRG domain-containing protein [Deltaproteobacteria bacterium]|nr:FRG domain-containing protein [Deltaproteobacteria bacterium]
MALNKGTQIVKGFPEWFGEDLSDFEEWIDIVSKKSKTVVFRGQRKYWPLLPSINRNNNLPESILTVEKELLNTFKKEAPPCLHLKPKSNWDWLVVGQHHGLPTRILDWSKDPLVALWFAIENYKKADSEPEVWALRVNDEDVIKSLDNTRPFQGTRSKLFETDFQIPRVKQQQGCFILFKYIEKQEIGFVRLERNSYLRGKIEKIRFFKRLVPDLLEQLIQKGYSRSFLFPDIDEVAKSVKEKVLNKLHNKAV